MDTNLQKEMRVLSSASNLLASLPTKEVRQRVLDYLKNRFVDSDESEDTRIASTDEETLLQDSHEKSKQLDINILRLSKEGKGRTLVSRELNISEGTVQRRVDKLKKAGLLASTNS